MRNSVNTYLAGLAVFDAFLLLLALFLYPPIAYAQHLRCLLCYNVFNYTVSITCSETRGPVW